MLAYLLSRLGRGWQVRVPAYVRARIEAVAGPHRMAAFIRETVERELERRERKKPADGQPPE
jgi:hypothetical protein